MSSRVSEYNIHGFQEQPQPPSHREPWEAPRGEGSGFPPVNPPDSYRKPLRRNANVVCFGAVIFYGVAMGISYLLAYLIYAFPAFYDALYSLSEVGITIIDMAVSILALLIPTLLVVLILDMPTKVAFPVRGTKPGLVIAGVFCCLGMSIVGGYVSTLLSQLITSTAGVTPTMPDFTPPMGRAEAVAYFISIAIVPAIFEELFFRGAIMQSLRRFGDGFAMIVSAILFALSHGNLVQGPNAFLVGLVLGYFALRTGTILTPIIMHFINNAIAAGLNLAFLYLPEEMANALSGGAFTLYIVFGIAGILLVRTVYGGFVAPLKGRCSLSEPEKYGLFFTTPFALIFIAVTVYLTMDYFV